MFVHRIQGIKEKLHGFEEFVQAQLDEPRGLSAERGRSTTWQSTEEANPANAETERHGYSTIVAAGGLPMDYQRPS